MSSREDREEREYTPYDKAKGLLIIAIIITGILVIVGNIITIVPSGHTGVEVTLGKVTGKAYSEGIHFKKPFVTSIVKISNQIQLGTETTSAVSKDLQAIQCDLAINFHMTADASAEMYRTIGKDYADKVLSPAIHETAKAIMAKYSAEQLITMRSTVSVEIDEALSKKVNTYGIVIDELNMTNFTFSPEFDAAIEAKQVAEQNKIKANTEKERRVIEAEAAASEKTIQAQAEAEAVKAKAEAEAEAIRVKAEAEAEANKKLAESLTDRVLQNKSIEKWDGSYPQMVSGDSADMLISISPQNTQNYSQPSQPAQSYPVAETETETK